MDGRSKTRDPPTQPSTASDTHVDWLQLIGALELLLAKRARAGIHLNTLKVTQENSPGSRLDLLASALLSPRHRDELAVPLEELMNATTGKRAFHNLAAQIAAAAEAVTALLGGSSAADPSCLGHVSAEPGGVDCMPPPVDTGQDLPCTFHANSVEPGPILKHRRLRQTDHQHTKTGVSRPQAVDLRLAHILSAGAPAPANRAASWAAAASFDYAPLEPTLSPSWSPVTTAASTGRRFANLRGATANAPAAAAAICSFDSAASCGPQQKLSKENSEPTASIHGTGYEGEDGGFDVARNAWAHSQRRRSGGGVGGSAYAAPDLPLSICRRRRLRQSTFDRGISGPSSATDMAVSLAAGVCSGDPTSAFTPSNKKAIHHQYANTAGNCFGEEASGARPTARRDVTCQKDEPEFPNDTVSPPPPSLLPRTTGRRLPRSRHSRVSAAIRFMFETELNLQGMGGRIPTCHGGSGGLQHGGLHVGPDSVLNGGGANLQDGQRRVVDAGGGVVPRASSPSLEDAMLLLSAAECGAKRMEQATAAAEPMKVETGAICRLKKLLTSWGGALQQDNGDDNAAGHGGGFCTSNDELTAAMTAARIKRHQPSWLPHNGVIGATCHTSIGGASTASSAAAAATSDLRVRRSGTARVAPKAGYGAAAAAAAAALMAAEDASRAPRGSSICASAAASAIAAAAASAAAAARIAEDCPRYGSHRDVSPRLPSSLVTYGSGTSSLAAAMCAAGLTSPATSDPIDATAETAKAPATSLDPIGWRGASGTAVRSPEAPCCLQGHQQAVDSLLDVVNAPTATAAPTTEAVVTAPSGGDTRRLLRRDADQMSEGGICSSNSSGSHRVTAATAATTAPPGDGSGGGSSSLPMTMPTLGRPEHGVVTAVEPGVATYPGAGAEADASFDAYFGDSGCMCETDMYDMQYELYMEELYWRRPYHAAMAAGPPPRKLTRRRMPVYGDYPCPTAAGNWSPAASTVPSPYGIQRKPPILSRHDAGGSGLEAGASPPLPPYTRPLRYPGSRGSPFPGPNGPSHVTPPPPPVVAVSGSPRVLVAYGSRRCHPDRPLYPTSPPSHFIAVHGHHERPYGTGIVRHATSPNGAPSARRPSPMTAAVAAMAMAGSENTGGGSGGVGGPTRLHASTRQHYTPYHSYEFRAWESSQCFERPHMAGTPPVQPPSDGALPATATSAAQEGRELRLLSSRTSGDTGYHAVTSSPWHQATTMSAGAAGVGTNINPVPEAAWAHSRPYGAGLSSSDGYVYGNAGGMVRDRHCTALQPPYSEA